MPTDPSAGPSSSSPAELAEKITDRWEDYERSCLHMERLQGEGLPFHAILSLRDFIAQAVLADRKSAALKETRER